MPYALFVCTHNAGRSQMGQAFFEKYEQFTGPSRGEQHPSVSVPAES